MKIKLPVATAGDRPPLRRGPALVLGEAGPPQGSGSPRGSTYYKRARRCPREHALAKVARLIPVRDDDALTTGYLFHASLETYYRARQAGAEVPAAEAEAWAKLRPVATEPGYEDTYATVERCVASYFDRYRDHDTFRVLAVEETIGVSWDGLDYSARLDTLIDDDGLWVLEHKTARALSPDLIEGYQLDLQTLGQVWLVVQALDLSVLPTFRGVRVNITTKHARPQHQRVEVSPTDGHLRAWERSMRSWQALIEHAQALGWPQTHGACTGPERGYRRCPYFDLCHGWPEKSVEAWQADDEPPEGFMRIDAATADVADWTREVSE